MYCTNCGHKIDPGDMFCEECGAKNVEFEIPRMLDEKNIQKDHQEADRDEEPPGMNDNYKVWMPVILAGVGIVLLAGFGFFAVSKITSGGEKAREAAVQEQNPETEEAGLNPEAKEPEETADDGQSAGSSEAKEHTYELVKQSVTWAEAKKICEEKGGYLATVTSTEEHEKILDLVKESELKVVWLGGIDEEENGEFEWITGEDFTFSDWGAGEPNNDQGIEHYLAMYKINGVWCWNDAPVNANSYYDSYLTGFICEYEE